MRSLHLCWLILLISCQTADVRREVISEPPGLPLPPASGPMLCPYMSDQLPIKYKMVVVSSASRSAQRIFSCGANERGVSAAGSALGSRCSILTT